ncbi:MAG TPA: type I secretion C-terminal target domain-containing protein, partial [Candidatus Competibacter sp.]|nr:type I secretion C-terminal target domain-containing protein [Candidatus Competibacter sp.]
NDTLAGDNDDDYLTGGAGNDLLLGGTGNDVLVGDAGIDYLIGGDGDDILLGGLDLDVLYGSGGSDWFVFQNATAFTGVDRITDFSLAENDVLQLADLLYDFDPLSDAITDFVKATEISGSSTIAVDLDGTGGAYGFQEFVMLMGVTGVSIQNLYDSGNIVAA